MSGVILYVFRLLVGCVPLFIVTVAVCFPDDPLVSPLLLVERFHSFLEQQAALEFTVGF